MVLSGFNQGQKSLKTPLFTLKPDQGERPGAESGREPGPLMEPVMTDQESGNDRG
jgi:hypothetical protein